MRSSSLPLVCTLFTLAASAASAQSLAQRVDRAPDSRTVTFQVPAQQNVCGYGDAMIRFHDGSRRGYSVMWHRGDWNDFKGVEAAELRERCEFGPLHVLLERDGRRITEVSARIAATPPANALSVGAATTAEAADYLVGTVARHASRRVAGEAMVVLTVAEGEYWQPLLALARDRSASGEIRKQAVFWVGQAASVKATQGLSSILGDESEEIGIRESAVFALSQQRNPESTDALMELAQTAKEPKIRRSALFWLGQKANDDPRVLALFEKILVGK